MQIPDSVSFEQLSDALVDAPTDPVEDNRSAGDYTQEELIETASKYVDEALDACKDPMVHKLMVLMVLNKFIDWHTQVGLKDTLGHETTMVSWLRDAGKLQAASTLVMDVSLGDDDFTCHQS